MLVLSRKSGERIIITLPQGHVTVRVHSVRNGTVTLCVVPPEGVSVSLTPKEKDNGHEDQETPRS